MKAKVTHPEGFSIFAAGVTTTYPMGTVLNDELAQKAVDARRASAMLKQKKAPANKAQKAPENKG